MLAWQHLGFLELFSADGAVEELLFEGRVCRQLMYRHSDWRLNSASLLPFSFLVSTCTQLRRSYVTHVYSASVICFQRSWLFSASVPHFLVSRLPSVSVFAAPSPASLCVCCTFPQRLYLPASFHFKVSVLSLFSVCEAFLL